MIERTRAKRIGHCDTETRLERLLIALDAATADNPPTR